MKDQVEEEADILTGLPQRLGDVKDLALTCTGALIAQKSLEPQHGGAPSNP